jgi:hypothetical protein
MILPEEKMARLVAELSGQFSADLREAFPDMGGLSPRNLLSMKLFAEAFPEPEITKQPVSQLPWEHISRCRLENPSHRNPPRELQDSLPTIAQLEAELAEDFMPSATKRKAKP